MGSEAALEGIRVLAPVVKKSWSPVKKKKKKKRKEEIDAWGFAAQNKDFIMTGAVVEGHRKFRPTGVL